MADELNRIRSKGRISKEQAAEELDLADKQEFEPSPKVELFARNLDNPSHMEWTHDGRLLVSEHSAGQITDITEGGDFEDAEPFAEGLEGPASMAMLDDGTIVASETYGGRVADITGGGDVSDREPYADGLEKPYSITRVERDGDERVYVSEDRKGIENWVTDITDGQREVVFDGFPVSAGIPGATPLARGEREGSFQSQWEHYASGNCGGGWLTATASGRLFAKGSHVGQVVELTGQEGKTFQEIVADGGVVARGLDHVGGIKVNEDDGLLYGAQPYSGSVFAIDPDRKANYQFTPPVVKGLTQPTCVRFGPDDGGDEMYVCGRGSGTVWRITDFK